MLISVSSVFAQATFEVASVKPSDPDARGGNFLFTPGGGVQIRNGPLQRIIEMAYDLRHFQVEGGPGWMSTDRFDIVAKSVSGEAPARMTPEAVQTSREKMQALLAERFGLKVHRESREMPILALVVTKNGPKLAEPAGKAGNMGLHMDCGHIIGTSATMLHLAHVLSNELDRPVEDRTGLTATYDFDLKWAPDDGPCHNDDDDRPSIYTSIQQQLGLKLEATKGPVEMLVVDGVERPKAN